MNFKFFCAAAIGSLALLGSPHEAHAHGWGWGGPQIIFGFGGPAYYAPPPPVYYAPPPPAYYAPYGQPGGYYAPPAYYAPQGYGPPGY